MLRVVSAVSEQSISQARSLFREYANMPGVVQCLGDFEKEVASLPGRYGPPAGRLLLAIQEGRLDSDQAVGCAALRKLDEEICEMKRLFVRPALRGKGIARELVHSLITEARAIGYKTMVLDTLPSMQQAHQLYRTLGFREIPSYQNDPIPDALFFELRLR